MRLLLVALVLAACFLFVTCRPHRKDPMEMAEGGTEADMLPSASWDDGMHAQEMHQLGSHSSHLKVNDLESEIAFNNEQMLQDAPGDVKRASHYSHGFHPMAMLQMDTDAVVPPDMRMPPELDLPPALSSHMPAPRFAEEEMFAEPAPQPAAPATSPKPAQAGAAAPSSGSLPPLPPATASSPPSSLPAAPPMTGISLPSTPATPAQQPPPAAVASMTASKPAETSVPSPLTPSISVSTPSMSPLQQQIAQAVSQALQQASKQQQSSLGLSSGAAPLVVQGTKGVSVVNARNMVLQPAGMKPKRLINNIKIHIRIPKAWGPRAAAAIADAAKQGVAPGTPGAPASATPAGAAAAGKPASPGSATPPATGAAAASPAAAATPAATGADGRSVVGSAPSSVPDTGAVAAVSPDAAHGGLIVAPDGSLVSAPTPGTPEAASLARQSFFNAKKAAEAGASFDSQPSSHLDKKDEDSGSGDDRRSGSKGKDKGEGTDSHGPRINDPDRTPPQKVFLTPGGRGGHDLDLGSGYSRAAQDIAPRGGLLDKLVGNSADRYLPGYLGASKWRDMKGKDKGPGIQNMLTEPRMLLIMAAQARARALAKGLGGDPNLMNAIQDLLLQAAAKKQPIPNAIVKPSDREVMAATPVESLSTDQILSQAMPKLPKLDGPTVTKDEDGGFSETTVQPAIGKKGGPPLREAISHMDAESRNELRHALYAKLGIEGEGD